MAYTITRSDGTVLTTVANDTVDTSSSLTLIGRNFSGYGGYVAENFVYLLENFAKTSPPANPLMGQHWYDKSVQRTKLWSGTTWVDINSASGGITITETTADNAGLTFYDPLAPANSRFYRFRERDDAPYAGHLVLESLNDNQSINTIILNTDNHGLMTLSGGLTLSGTLQINGTATGQTPTIGDNSGKLATTQFVATSFAPIASPGFTGSPTAPTPTFPDSTTKLATTQFVSANFAPLASPPFTGTPTAAPGPTYPDNSTKLATTAFVSNNFAPIASPALTGTPTATATIPVGDNSNRLATTAFVKSSVQGKLLGWQIFGGNATYVPTPGMRFVIFEVQGGGASGGGTQATGSGQAAAGGGGGAGGYVSGSFTAAAVGASQAVTVGAVANGVIGSPGNPGNPSSVGSLISAPGGNAGDVGLANTSFVESTIGGGPSAAGTGGNILTKIGGAGIGGICFAALNCGGGAGGASHYGPGAPTMANGNGGNWINYGAGGGGGQAIQSSGNTAGGSGGPGHVVAWEYS